MKNTIWMNKTKKELVEHVKRLEKNEEVYKEQIAQQYTNATKLLKECEENNKINKNAFTVEILEDEIRRLKKMYISREPYHSRVNNRFIKIFELIQNIK